MGARRAQSREAGSEDGVCSGERPVAEHQPGWARGAPGSRGLCTDAGQLRLTPAAAFAGVADPGTAPLQTPLPVNEGPGKTGE